VAAIAFMTVLSAAIGLMPAAMSRAIDSQVATLRSTHGTRPRNWPHGAEFAAGFGTMVVLLTLPALYLDLRSAVGWGSGRAHLTVVARQTSDQVVFDGYESSRWLWPAPRPREIRALRVSDWVDATAL
jgi:hypothetical protein